MFFGSSFLLGALSAWKEWESVLIDGSWNVEGCVEFSVV